MVFELLKNIERVVFSIEYYCSRFYRQILVGIFFMGVFLQGYTNILALFSGVGYLFILLRLVACVVLGKAEQLLAAIILLVGSSYFLPTGISLVFSYALALIGFYAIFLDCRDFRFLRNNNSAFYFLLAFVGIFFWGAGCKNNQVLMIDNYHPFYELGIGRCVEWGNWLSNWLPKDMAFLGGSVRFHFLATRLPYLFSYLGNTSIFSSIAFLIPAIFLWIASMVAEIFKDEFLFLSQSGQRLLLCCFLSAAVFFTVPSVALASILAFLIVLFLGRKNFFVAAIALIFLLLTKFTFFVGIFSAWAVLAVYAWFVTKKFPLKQFISGFVVFFLGAGLYIHFLSGAHPHCLWLPLPWVFVNPFRPHFLTQALPFDFWALVVIVLQIILGFWTFKKAYHKENVIAVISMCFSMGLIWRYFLLSEFVEGNNFQFTTLNPVFFLLLLLFLTSKEGFLEIYRVFQIVLNVCCKKLIEFFCKIIVAFYGIKTYLLSVMYPFKAAVIFLFMGQGNSIDMRVINAWSFLQKKKDSYGAVSGKHYEIRGRYSHDSDLPGDRGFLASGFSGKQLFTEGYCSRGIMMNPDYPKRVAYILTLFKKYTRLSVLSQESFRNHFDDIEYLLLPAYPMSQSPSGMIRILHKLTLGREWHRVNYEKKMYQEMQQELRKIQSVGVEAMLNYFKEHNIRYLVLENGDLPTPILQQHIEVLYKDDFTQVLWLK